MRQGSKSAGGPQAHSTQGFLWGPTRSESSDSSVTRRIVLGDSKIGDLGNELVVDVEDEDVKRLEVTVRHHL